MPYNSDVRITLSNRAYEKLVSFSENYLNDHPAYAHDLMKNPDIFVKGENSTYIGWNQLRWVPDDDLTPEVDAIMKGLEQLDEDDEQYYYMRLGEDYGDYEELENFAPAAAIDEHIDYISPVVIQKFDDEYVTDFLKGFPDPVPEAPADLPYEEERFISIGNNKVHEIWFDNDNEGKNRFIVNEIYSDDVADYVSIAKINGHADPAEFFSLINNNCRSFTLYEDGDDYEHQFYNDIKHQYLEGNSLAVGENEDSMNKLFEHFDLNIEKAEVWRKLEKKAVLDSDGFYTDYTMYENINAEGEPKYVCVFGDEELYMPHDHVYDWESDSYDEIKEWFDNYNGFDEPESQPEPVRTESRPKAKTDNPYQRDNSDKPSVRESIEAIEREMVAEHTAAPDFSVMTSPGNSGPGL